VAIPKDGLIESPLGEETADAEGPQLHAGLRARDSETGEIRRATLVPVARRERTRVSTPGSESPPLQNAVIRPGVMPRQKDEAGDGLNYVLDRLRELGAVYYLLETWGNDGQRFRFHCKMAIGGNPAYTRHFEAIDRDAIQAMARVLAEVETWRTERERP
jgi:hypothetical protein